jgi:predicted AAA+ superfamily ATPase
MVSKLYKRPVLAGALRRTREPRRFIQILAGPRQVGKTTLARQVIAAVDLPSHFASADEPTLRDRAWLVAQWEVARDLARAREGALLVLDEIQKVTGWSEAVKRLWDEDTAARRRLRVILLGSAPLLIQKGMTESLGGRFELIRLWHWSFHEMHEAFGWDLDRYIYFGGYPGAAPLVDDEARWAGYIRDSLIETTISRDILLLTRIDKPALLRQLFGLACDYSAQIVSYTALLGQLQDAGNTTTLAHYLELLAGAGMVVGLSKYSGSRARQRASIPKLLVMNTALMSAMAGGTFAQARADSSRWGRLVESAVGAHLLAPGGDGRVVHYWRERDREVDFVVYERGGALTAIEVASGRNKGELRGMEAFLSAYPKARPLLVGGDGMPLGTFFRSYPSRTS